MGALSRALILALSVGLVGCTVKTMPIVGEPAPRAVPQEAAPVVTEASVEPVSGEYGWLNLTVRWPQAEGYQISLLPTTTNAIAIWVSKDNVPLGAPTVVSRKPGVTTATASIRVESATNLSVEIKAYRETAPDLGSAVPIAQKAKAGVSVMRSKVTPLALSLDPMHVPTVASFSRNLGKVGETVTVTGTNFGSGAVPTPTVTFNGTPATTVTRNSETSLTAVVPNGATSGYVQVRADGVDSKSESTFWVLSSFSISSPERGLWDTDSMRMVRYGQTKAFNETHAWAWLSVDDEISGRYGNPPLPTWSSSNPTAGQINESGLFTAGTTTATASVTARFGSIVSNAFEVRSIGVDSVSLDQTALTLNALPTDGLPDQGYVTETRLTATVVSSVPGDRGVTWSTSDPSRVTVSDTGLVQTVKDAPEGTATITATSKEDSTKKATATVTVTILGDLELGIE